jgi:transketolase
VAWKFAIEHQKGPSCLLLSRQNLPHMSRDKKMLSQIKRGAYILLDTHSKPDAIIIATGSEVHLAVKAAQSLAQQGHKIRVVSMPSTTVFDQQDVSYQESVLPRGIQARVAVEAAAKDFWYKYVGRQGKIIGLDQYGESAPYQDVYNALGITVENIEKAVKSLL